MKETAVSKRTPGRRPLLTQEVQQRICAFIRAGAYHYAAAEACRIDRRTFFDWMARGEGTSDRPRSARYVEFVREVRAAEAECRVGAEVAVRRADPKWWLARMHRDQPDAQGWTGAAARPHPESGGGLSIHVHLDDESIDQVRENHRREVEATRVKMIEDQS